MPVRFDWHRRRVIETNELIDLEQIWSGRTVSNSQFTKPIPSVIEGSALMVDVDPALTVRLHKHAFPPYRFRFFAFVRRLSGHRASTADRSFLT
jgi:hypothetical protein